MARYTTACSAFVTRLDEVDLLRLLALAKERENPLSLRNEINALCRGALVLLCGHLEAYVKELGEVALTSLTVKRVPRSKLSSQLYYYVSQDSLSELQKTAEPEKIAEKVFDFIEKDLNYWSKVGPFPQPIQIDRFNYGFSNPGFKRIKKYFNRFGYADYSRDLGHRLKGNYLPTVNMVDHLVDTRNKIAHGDRAISKTPAEVYTIMIMTRRFTGSTDAVFATWWKTCFCAIR